MTYVEGEIRVGEAKDVTGKLHRHQVGPPWYLLAAPVIPAMVIAASFLAEWLRRSLGLTMEWENYTFVPGLGVGVVLYLWLVKYVLATTFRARLTSQGQPVVMQHRVEITCDALSYSRSDVEFRARWTAVTELFGAGRYWVFLAQAHPVFVPRLYFTDETAERSFLAEALKFMTPEARNRSTGAQRAAGLV